MGNWAWENRMGRWGEGDKEKQITNYQLPINRINTYFGGASLRMAKIKFVVLGAP